MRNSDEQGGKFEPVAARQVGYVGDISEGMISWDVRNKPMRFYLAA